MAWYKEKKEFHYKQWEIAVEAGKENAIKHHMQEYLNYQEMEKQVS